MKTKIKIEQEVELTFLKVQANPRYCQDTEVNGASDKEGKLMPFLVAQTIWSPVIEINTGKVIEWPKGTTAKVHYKVCDAGSYYLTDQGGSIFLSIEDDYVPSCLCPTENGYGDYIIMNIDETGQIEGWPKEPDISDFYPRDDD